MTLNKAFCSCCSVSSLPGSSPCPALPPWKRQHVLLYAEHKYSLSHAEACSKRAINKASATGLELGQAESNHSSVGLSEVVQSLRGSEVCNRTAKTSSAVCTDPPQHMPLDCCSVRLVRCDPSSPSEQAPSCAMIKKPAHHICEPFRKMGMMSCAYNRVAIKSVDLNFKKYFSMKIIYKKKITVTPNQMICEWF